MTDYEGWHFQTFFSLKLRSHFGGRIKECFLSAFCFNSLGYYFCFFFVKGGNFLQKIFLIVIPKIGEF